MELEGTATEYNLGAAVDVGYGEKLQLKMAAANERNVGPTSEVCLFRKEKSPSRW